MSYVLERNVHLSPLSVSWKTIRNSVASITDPPNMTIAAYWDVKQQINQNYVLKIT